MTVVRGCLLLAFLFAGASLVSAVRAGRSAARSLPVYGELKAFSLLDQAGRPVTADSLRGAVHVIDFIFTACPDVCPRLTAQMARLQERTAVLPVRLVSFTVDPKRDTPERLREYGERYHANFARWRFVTGDPAAMRSLIVGGFFTAMGNADVDGVPGPRALAHGESFVVTDAAGRLRAFRPAATERDLDDIVATARELAQADEPLAE